MSYISILLAAFHLNTSNKNELIKLCCNQFNLSDDKFELIDFNDNTNQKHFVIKFKESILSLNSMEELLYQRECIKSISEKAFESLKLMIEKLKELENQVKSFHKNDNNEEIKKKH